ncbi:MAG TPA: hypothetical protein VN256_08220 [Pyrinomonadaceae bacterium]|nr:hypothetical protein [Pyrinomonadaceae bacterium]
MRQTLLFLLVNAGASWATLRVLIHVLRRRPNIDGRFYAGVLLFVLFCGLVLGTSGLLAGEAPGGCPR